MRRGLQLTTYSKRVALATLFPTSQRCYELFLHLLIHHALAKRRIELFELHTLFVLGSVAFLVPTAVIDVVGLAGFEFDECVLGHGYILTDFRQMTTSGAPGRIRSPVTKDFTRSARKILSTVDPASPRAAGLRPSRPPGIAAKQKSPRILRGSFVLCAGEDSNLRRPKPADLQSALVDRLSTDAI